MSVVPSLMNRCVEFAFTKGVSSMLVIVTMTGSLSESTILGRANSQSYPTLNYCSTYVSSSKKFGALFLGLETMNSRTAGSILILKK